MPWVRSGFCCRCGDCCRGDPFENSKDGASELMKQAPERPGWCPLLRFHIGGPDGDTTCAGHIGYVPPGEEDPYYMQGCVIWPAHPDQIADKPRCTYAFEWVDD